MIDPFADDSWDELTRELGVEKSAPPPEPAEEDPAQDYDLEPQTEDEAFDSGLEPEGDAPDGAEAPSEDQPGTGKKRRRRRRRRRKGPEDGEAAGEPAAAEGEETPAEPAYVETEYETGPGSEAELAAVSAGTDEDSAGEMLRDLIANWNVPSWDSIVTGLYRPER